MFLYHYCAEYSLGRVDGTMLKTKKMSFDEKEYQETKKDLIKKFNLKCTPSQFSITSLSFLHEVEEE